MLHVNDLHVYYHTPSGVIRAVNGVSFSLGPGERLGLVGESGSGKSTTALAIMRLIENPGRVERGQVILDGVNLLALTPRQMRQARFADVSLIPQGAMNSLNPVIRIEDQIRDIFTAHGVALTRQAFREKVDDLLNKVGLQPTVAAMFPHELSGGMKQRVCIAMAIALQPKLIIADEPTSALDVVVQRQVIQTLIHAQSLIGAAIILVGHDMGLMAQAVDYVGVMYAGQLIEIGTVRQIFEKPLHPYTQMLIESIPTLVSKKLFRGIPGVAPSLLDPPGGCPFHPRCPQALPHCAHHVPRSLEPDTLHRVSCHLYDMEEVL
jgi:peptide/nickel transport system ATP-binding protein